MTDMNLLVETREHGDWTIVDVKGEVDLYTAPRLKERLKDLVGAGKHRLLVNLEGVEFMDSTGLGVLIGALKRAREANGALELAGLRNPVRKVLSITGLNRVFTIHESADRATGA
jgi:anti-sigma B factor antagonist